MSIEPNNFRLRWRLGGSVNATGATGAEFQAFGDGGDFSSPTAVINAAATELVLEYGQQFFPGESSWLIQSSPPGVLTPGTTFLVPEGADF